MSVIADPWNPTSAEVRAWAYTPGAMYPCEDWDLSLSWIGHERDYLEFASDSACPNREFFLHVLYLMVGDVVRTAYRNVPEPVLKGFIDLGKNADNEDLLLWHKRSLLVSPLYFRTVGISYLKPAFL